MNNSVLHEPFSSAAQAAEWLEANPAVLEAAWRKTGCDLRMLCDEIALEPAAFGGFVSQLLQEARRAGAPAEVLDALKAQAECTKEGLQRLPYYAYSWLSLVPLRRVNDKAKARSILTEAIARAPDANNRLALRHVLQTILHHDCGGGAETGPGEAWEEAGKGFDRRRGIFCCILACIECQHYCLFGCGIGCLLCGMDGFPQGSGSEPLRTA